MERDWERRTPLPEIPADTVRVALATYTDPLRYRSHTGFEGGKVNWNLRVELGAPHASVVLRVYARAPEAAPKEAALLRRLSGQLPLPELLGTGQIEDPTCPKRGPAEFVLLAFVPGVVLDQVLPTAAPAVCARAGEELGRAMACIHAHPMPELGFLDGELEVARPMGDLQGAWSGYVLERIGDTRVACRLGSARIEALRTCVRRERPGLAALLGPAVLAHGDCKPTNVLVDPDGRLRALLDWEFAWAGDPLFDFGQMFRWPVPPAFGEALIASYRTAGGVLRPGWRRQARVLDLVNLIGFLEWDGERPRAQAEALQLIDATVAALEATGA